ncbi:hypothetical protein LOD99_7174 [Oopsacas minuta]|uniref:Uncharacterized protein n=1 Tax=Oopsacas minuta TaxID=111878 RepID=A0AAV7JTA6_9METZ|nr:hypothetical protein LOD99_7174 [Oopsacas minuta]
MVAYNNNSLIDLQFNLNRLCDGVVHREIISISESEFQPTLEFLRQLIATKFHIPLICQINLSLSGVPIGCLPPDCQHISSRLWKKGERLVFNLDYYTNSVLLTPIIKLLAQFDEIMKDKNYRLLYVLLHSLNHEHINKHGWESNEALGTRLYLYNCNFLDLLFSCINSLNGQLFDLEKDIPCQQNSETQLELFGTADSICTALNAAMELLWNLGARSTDRILLFRKGFLDLSQQSERIACGYRESPHEQFRGIGKALSGSCLGAIQGYSELRAPALKIGNDIRFMATILYNIINSEEYSTQHMEDVLRILILFSCSNQYKISLIFIQRDFYSHLLNHFVTRPLVRNYSNSNYEIFYIVCLLMLNWLKTPLADNPPTELMVSLVRLFKLFSTSIELQHILDFEDHTGFIWGTLDPFLSFFFIPRTSIIGRIYYNSSSHVGIALELLKCYFRVLVFSLDVILHRDLSRQQLLEEDLFTFLIIADWYVPDAKLLSRIKQWYPEISYLPVPSLYNISATQAVVQGYGEFPEVIHPIL